MIDPRARINKHERGETCNEMNDRYGGQHSLGADLSYARGLRAAWARLDSYWGERKVGCCLVAVGVIKTLRRQPSVRRRPHLHRATMRRDAPARHGGRHVVPR